MDVGQLNEQGMPMDQDVVPFVIVPLIHELTANSTQLAEKRATGARKFFLL
jgi:hypothetical protein